MEISLLYPRIPKSVLKAANVVSSLALFSWEVCVYCFVFNFFSTSLSTLEGREQFFICFFFYP